MKKDDSNHNKKTFSKKKKNNTHIKEDQQAEEQPQNNVHRGQHNGIADYFAILGIGDNLQMMKATQPKSHGQHEENNPNDDSCRQEQEKEEQCQMMQRFYREIVHVGILSVYSGNIRSPGAPSWSRGRSSSMDNGDDSIGCDGRTSTIYAAHLASTATTSANFELSHDDFDAKDGDSNCDEYYNNYYDGSGSAQECHYDHDRNECSRSRRRVPVPPLIPLMHPRPGIGIAGGKNETNNGGDSVVVMKKDYDYFLPEQVDGFQIIYKTVPASAPFHQPGCHQQQQQRQQQQQQESFFQGGHDVSLNMSSLSMNTTFDGSSSKDAHDCEENAVLGGELWTKGQTFLANMHPCEGYRSKLLSSNISLSSSLAAGALEDDSLLLDTTNPTMNSSGTSHVVTTRQLLDVKYKKDSVEQNRGNDKNGGKLFSKITRPTMSKLRQHIFSPLLHHHHHQNSTSFAKDENHVDLLVENKSHLNHYKCVSTPRGDSSSKHSTSEKACVPIQKKEFYIGYRRREPDETDIPGIADCKIVYCRIHKDSILPEKMDLGKRLRITCNGLHHGVGGGEGDDGIIADKACGSTERVVTNNVQTKNNSASKQKMTVAVMKNSLMATAEIAKNVVSHGRDRLRMATLTGLNDPVLPTFDAHVEKAEDEMNGNVEHHFGITRGVSKECDSRFHSGAAYDVVNLDDLLDIPEGYDEWVIPEMYQQIRLPVPPSPSTSSPRNRIAICSELDESFGSPSKSKACYEMHGESTDRHRMQRTFLVNSNDSPSADNAGVGVEAYVDGNTFLNHSPKQRNPWSPVKGYANKVHDVLSLHSLDDEKIPSQSIAFDRGEMLPCVIEDSSLPSPSGSSKSNCIYHEYVPLLALRRQRIRNEERYREDPSIIDLGMTFTGLYGDPVMPVQEEEDFEDDENEGSQILGISPWTSQDIFSYASSKNARFKDDTEQEESVLFGTPHIITRRNVPLGFLDTPFATSVLDRFPKKDYKGLPLPEEELPMFCYPTGCKLIRLKYQDSPLPEHYGFVVKNERGDSVYVSCISFVESLTSAKQQQLNEISKSRIMTSLPHRAYWQQQGKSVSSDTEDESGLLVGFNDVGNRKSLQGDQFLTGFDDMMTFEYKTICIISRYPFWSAFRRFLSHLHILSGSSSDVPLERYISHLMLTVPVPKPGGQCILVPLPAVASPMVIGLPPLKDFPVLDLSFRRLFSCLDVPTVVTIVLGFLALERKVIIMSTYPSLVSDACELLKSLLFPFELCAPYVPRLTEPFMSCLEFPGAIFAGIHDDRSEDGLAANVRKSIPDDTFIVDLDTGDIDCNGERFDALKECWEIIPNNARSLLVEEIEMLCQDVKLIPGQEPPGSELEAALDTADVSFAPIFEEEDIWRLDDRAIRDAFLRFYCYLLGGYERFLLVPDIDFVVSGNEWFDTKGFLASVEKQSRVAYLHSFLSTQLFQSFIQRRTEASDVHCLLFDECLAEYHSSQESFGRLTDSLDQSDTKQFATRYELLVDRCAAEFSSAQEVDESSSAGTSTLTSHTTEGFMINNTGDLVTVPSKRNLPPGHRYVYCIDGHPHFPEEMDVEMFYPKEPDVLPAEPGNLPVPILIRSDREHEVSSRRKRLSASRRGVHRQRRCLFQLPKLMGSHVLSSWLMCIPFQVIQQFRSLDQQNVYLNRALGALRWMRSRYRIVPDEAGYRCLIVACGRVQSDRRQDVAKLFGLLRSDGIFPSAVTLGQYTRSIAEGYSKSVSGKPISTAGESSHIPGFSWSDNMDERLRNLHVPNALDFLDRNLINLDKVGMHWRKGREIMQKEVVHSIDPSRDQCSKRKQNSRDTTLNSILRCGQDWMPVSSSSSFSPHWKPPDCIDDTFNLIRDFRFIALWSRTTICHSCQYELLDEEIQAGWDEELDDDIEILAKLNCPCCGSLVHPRLGYIEMTPCTQDVFKGKKKMATKCHSNLPAQLRTNLRKSNLDDKNDEGKDERLGYVPYLSPSRMRAILEQIVNEFGENILDREKLRYLNPTLFFNLWWFCCRFSLPLPLAISTVCSKAELDAGAPVYNNHCCAFAAWDKSTAIAACNSASKAIFTLQSTITKNNRPTAAPEFKELVKSFQNHSISGMEASHNDAGENLRNSQSILQAEFPLLAGWNFHALSHCDWENDYLSKILVKLVEACDKRDLYPALEAVLHCNEQSQTNNGCDTTIELDCYRTLLYLSRYHCTSAFHKFFPTTTKTCKGYHFWCPNTTVSIFDHLFREAMERLRAEGNVATVHDISDVALGFRSVFGHII